MFGKSILAIYILVAGLLVSNVLSLAWMILVQICALAGLVLIGTIFLSGRSDQEPSPPDYDLDHEDFR